MGIPGGISVLITSYLEPEHIATIRGIDPRLSVIYAPQLLRPPRYPGDHTGAPDQQRDESDEQIWQALLAQADVLFDFDPTHPQDLPELAPHVRWVQSTSAGIGQLVAKRRYHERWSGCIFTTASGIHARPLAEFCVLAMLMFNKRLYQMLDDQKNRRWERYAGNDFEGRTLGIVGLGNIGEEVARQARGCGLRIVGMNTSGRYAEAVDVLYRPSQLNEMLEQCHYLVVCVPHTPQTEHIIGAQELAALPSGAIFINIGRGAAVDEQALIDALRSGHVGGAALDVFATEPLPPDNPLWTMPNVLVSPHSASTSDRENSRITALFCDNLRRFLDGQPLKNVLDIDKLY